MDKIWLDESSWVYQSHLPHTLVYDFENIWNLHPTDYPKIRIFGNVVKVPRYQQSYIRSYIHENTAFPLPSILQPFLMWANTLNYGEFNQGIVNWYVNGTQYIGKHSDNEHPLVQNSVILSISLGAERIFRFRSKLDGVITDLSMPDRTYLIMGGDVQKKFTHEVVKIFGTNAIQVGRRINITLRQFL